MHFINSLLLLKPWQYPLARLPDRNAQTSSEADAHLGRRVEGSGAWQVLAGRPHAVAQPVCRRRTCRTERFTSALQAPLTHCFSACVVPDMIIAPALPAGEAVAGG